MRGNRNQREGEKAMEGSLESWNNNMYEQYAS
jgi:hypothetical protein